MEHFCIGNSPFMQKDFPKSNPYGNAEESNFQKDLFKLANYNNVNKGIVTEELVEWVLHENICRDSLKWFLEYFCAIEDKEFLDWIYTETTQYTFFCDETNNNIKFQFKNENGELNSEIENDFVLGGVVYAGKKAPAEIEDLFKSFALQPNVRDVKLSHILKKDKTKSKFERVLVSPKISILFDWLLEKDVWVQFSAINLLYYSLVDIIDSIIVMPKEMLDEMKNILFEKALADKDYFLGFLARYGYPHIAEERIRPFCEEFIDWIEGLLIDNPMEDFYLEMARQQLKVSKRDNHILYLEHRSDRVLIDDYKSVYFSRLLMFRNSYFYFDEISEIQNGFENDYQEICQKERNGAYEFCKSHESKWMQLADIVVGIIGAFFTFSNSFEEKSICEIFNKFDDISKRNLIKFCDILNKSAEENRIFHSYSACFREIEKCQFIFRIANLYRNKDDE